MLVTKEEDHELDPVWATGKSLSQREESVQSVKGHKHLFFPSPHPQLYEYMCACMCVLMCVCACMCVCTCVLMCGCVCVHVRACPCAYMYMCVHVCVHMHARVCTGAGDWTQGLTHAEQALRH